MEQKIAKGYIRVSTTMQKEDGVSLETQAEKIKNYCIYEGLNLIKIYEDAGISGAKMGNRPGLMEMIKSIQKGDYLIFSTLSRLGRNAVEILQTVDLIKKKKATLVLLDLKVDSSTPTGKVVIGIMGMLYEQERENIAQNVSDNMQRLSREGKLRGRPPFGWKFVDKELDFEVVPEQQEVINIIVTLRAEGNNNSKIAEQLNSEGKNVTLTMNKANPKVGQLFFPGTVAKILQVYDNNLAEKRIKTHKV